MDNQDNQYCRLSLPELYAWANAGILEQELGTCLAWAHPDSAILNGAEPDMLAVVLERAGRHRNRLARLAAASALLGVDCPTGFWSHLEAELPDIPLEAMRRGVWRPALVPCIKGTRAVPATLLCGHAAAYLLPNPPDGLHDEPVEAVKIAIRLAGKKWGGCFAVWEWSGLLSLNGASLGLPVFLALGCAASGLSVPRAFATGRLDDSGRVRCVGHVTDKAGLARTGLFLFPAGSEYLPREQDVGVENVDEAWECWTGCGQGAVPGTVLALHRSLADPDRLFGLLQLCATPEVEMLRANGNIDRIQEGLDAKLDSPQAPLGNLRRLLEKVASSKSKEHGRIRLLLTDIFDKPRVQRLAKIEPAIAWRLCMLHLRRCNHAGAPEKAREWLDLSRDWERHLESGDSQEELISHALSVVAFLHNTYNFIADPIETMGPRFSELYDIMQRDYRRRKQQGQPRNRAIGSWLGTMAQHHAYRGELEQTETCIHEALECFEGEPADQAMEYGYRFFARLDADRQEALDDLLEILQIRDLSALDPDRIRGRAEYDCAWNLFSLARYLADTGTKCPAFIAAMPDMLAMEKDCSTVWGYKANDHPWQLVLYNLGRLAADPPLKRRFWEASLDACRHAEPTVRVMALLPLAALHDAGMLIIENEVALMREIRECIEKSLFTEHFSILSRELKAEKWTEALRIVSANINGLFPFNYR